MNNIICDTLEKFFVSHQAAKIRMQYLGLQKKNNRYKWFHDYLSKNHHYSIEIAH